jgi:F-type H+-transporting ATPase subunit delta
MNEEIIASRYARAIFDIAVEGGDVEEMDRALDRAARAAAGDKELESFWASPIIERSRKREVLDRVIESMGISGSLEAALRFLLEKERFYLLKYVARSFHTLAREYLNLATVKLTTAIPLSAEEMEEVQQRLQEKTGKTIVIEQERDPSILGGFVVRIENTVFDGSARGRLERLARGLAG